MRMRLTEGSMRDAMQGHYVNLSCVEMQQIWYAGYATRRMHSEVSIGTEGRDNRDFLHLPTSFFLKKN